MFTPESWKLSEGPSGLFSSRTLNGLFFTLQLQETGPYLNQYRYHAILGLDQVENTILYLVWTSYRYHAVLGLEQLQIPFCTESGPDTDTVPLYLKIGIKTPIY